MNPLRPSSEPCAECGAANPFILHKFHLRASTLRLCTDCALREHQGHFCPFCLTVYVEPLPASQRAMCLNCPSIAHLSCASPSPSFRCPPCSNPRFSFFRNAAAAVEENGGVIDFDSAKALVAAAQISAKSMGNAAAAARSTAETRVQEAVWLRKKAKEALERVALSAKQGEKVREREANGGVVKTKGRFHNGVMDQNKRIRRG